MPKVVVNAGKGLVQHAGSGHVHLRGAAPAMTVKYAAPAEPSGAATITIANLLTGVMVQDPTTDRAWTLPTNTLIRAGLDDPQIGDCIDFAIINTGTASEDEIITLGAGSGGTLVGSGAVLTSNPVDDAFSSGSGLFRIRISSATAYVCYRLA